MKATPPIPLPRPGARAHAIHGAPACFNLDKVVSQVFQLLLDTSLVGLSDCHHTDHSGDANGNPQYGKRTAELVPQQGPERGGYQSCVIHHFLQDEQALAS